MRRGSTVFVLSDAERQALVRFVTSRPVSGWSFESWPYGTIRIDDPDSTHELLGIRAKLVNRLSTEGFVIVDCQEILAGKTNSAAAAIVTAITSLVGSPLKVFRHLPHWRQISVRLDRPAGRSEGVGRIPLHVDFVNASDPPDLVALMCLRDDPLGGGANMLARFASVLKMLAPDEKRALRQNTFKDGEVRDLDGVGVDVNPFSVLAEGKWGFRFTERLLEAESDPRVRAVLVKVSRSLGEGVQTARLTAGSLLVLDQHRVVHGRAPLGKGQGELKPGERRLGLQSFIRAGDG